MKKLILLCAVLMVAPLSAMAKDAYHDYYGLEEYGLRNNTTRVEFYGGVAEPQSNWTHNGQEVEIGKTGFSAGLAFLRNIGPFFTLGLDGNYAGFASGDKFNAGTQKAKYTSGIATGLVIGRFNFFPSQPTRFYVTSGLGIGHMFSREKFDDGTHDTVNSTSWAGMLGAGVEFDVDDTVIFGVEGRYNLVDLDGDYQDALGKGRYHYLSALLKIGCRF